MNLNLAVVHPHFIDRAWCDGAGKLDEALERANGEVTIEQLRLQLSRGELTLLALRDDEAPVGWIVVAFEQKPNLRVLFVYAIWAPHHAVEQAWELLMAYARDGGASRVRGACGDAVARLWESRFGFAKAYTIMERDI